MAAKGQLRIRIVGDDSDMGSFLKGATGKIAAAGAAIGTAFSVGLAKTLNVQAANDKLAAQLGLSAEESKRIGGVAGKLYADAYGDSIESVNTAVGAVVSSIDGMRTASSDAVQAMTAKVLDLSAAFEVDTARAAQVAGQMITSGLAKDGAHALDLLVASMQNVPAAVREDLIDAIDEYAPFMASIGVKGERAMALLVGAAQKGAFGLDKTGDALKEFTVRSTDMSAKTKDAYKALGLDTEKMTKALLASGDQGAEAFEKIVKGLQGMKDPAAQSAAALALFGTPLEDLNVSEIPTFLDSLTSARGKLGDTAGAAERMGDTLNDNAKTTMTTWMRKAEMAFVNLLGGKVIPAIEKAVGWLKDKFGPQLDAIGRVLDEILIPAVIALGVATLAAGIKMAVGWIIGLGPIAWIIAAVVGLTVLIVSNWDFISSWLSFKWEEIKSTARSAWEHIKSSIVDPIVKAAQWVSDRVSAIRQWFAELPGKIGEALSTVWNIITWPFREAIDFVTGLWDGLVRRVRGAVDDVKNALSTIKIGFEAGAKNLPIIGGFFRAEGGPVSAGRPYVVGERGPEWFIPGVSGMVLSNADVQSLMDQADSDARAMLGGASAAGATRSAGGGTIHITLDFDGADADLKRLFRRAVKVEGRGSAERFFAS